MMRKILISDSRQEKFDGKKEFSLTMQTKLKLVEIGERSGGYKVEINARTMQRRWRFLKLIGTSRRNRKKYFCKHMETFLFETAVKLNLTWCVLPVKNSGNIFGEL